MRSGVIRFFIFLIIIIVIIFIVNLLYKNNVFNFSNLELFEPNNINTFRIDVEQVSDNYDELYYNVDLEKGEFKYYRNSGMIDNNIELINYMKLTEQEIMRLKDLINNASQELPQGTVNYYKISNNKYIYTLDMMTELENILGK